MCKADTSSATKRSATFRDKLAETEEVVGTTASGAPVKRFNINKFGAGGAGSSPDDLEKIKNLEATVETQKKEIEDLKAQVAQLSGGAAATGEEH